MTLTKKHMEVFLSSLVIMIMHSLINAMHFCVHKQPQGSMQIFFMRNINGHITVAVYSITQIEETTERSVQTENSSMISSPIRL